ncbi:hypothetical protein GS429_18535 [Natronorubrum sp. JWXQ-INN-674]|uniref:Uncharacterized protein n=1 Tax=Natronorubrum halalkaliphilum TaxID=2691917 RepID=A0A6B0VRF9_9EURY|nr:hypothetical protein [Natronorubrum halalkaliphilum]MXV64024.1 hypothetical protein [Natronorubrum halalkaliphilum]
MVDDTPDRNPIVSEGRYAIVDAGESEAVDFWLVADGEDDASDAEHRVPLERTEIDDAYAVLSRLRAELTDADDGRDSVELSCHSCGKTWTYTGSDEHVACPNCETEVPIEGVGP